MPSDYKPSIASPTGEDLCFYGLVRHRAPAYPDGGAATLNYFGGQPNNPDTPNFDPVPEAGLMLQPHTDDDYVSACVWSRDGIKMVGSTTSGNPDNPNDTNYFHSVINGTTPARRWSFKFNEPHKCAVLDKVFILGTDVDVGEQYDTSAFVGTHWQVAPENSVPGAVGGVFAASTANQTFALMWDVKANGLPPEEVISAASTTGQSVFIYMADYYVPLETRYVKGRPKHYYCGGEWEDPVVTNVDLGVECCGECDDPEFYVAPLLNANSLVTTTAPAYEYRDMWAEESGATDANSAEWSFGNGATGFIGLPLDDGWEVVAMYFHSDQFPGNGDIQVDLMNYGTTPSNAGANTVTSITLSSPTDGGGAVNNAYKYEDISPPVLVPPGAVLGFITRTETGNISDARVGVRLRRKVADFVTGVSFV